MSGAGRATARRARASETTTTTTGSRAPSTCAHAPCTHAGPSRRLIHPNAEQTSRWRRGGPGSATATHRGVARWRRGAVAERDEGARGACVAGARRRGAPCMRGARSIHPPPARRSGERLWGGGHRPAGTAHGCRPLLLFYCSCTAACRLDLGHRSCPSLAAARACACALWWTTQVR